MTTRRLLLPFAREIDAKAISHAVRFAKASQSTLVALALICSSETPQGGVRPEHIQQAQDFLELIQTKADFSQVIVERHKRFTTNVGECILACAQQLNCEGILLISNAGAPRFLTAHETKYVQQARQFSLYLLELPSMRKV